MIVSRRFRSLSTLLLVTASSTAVAQTPTPEASPTVSPFTYALPGTPSPTPASTPEPLDTPVPAAAATPTPRATPSPRVTPTPRASPTPQPRATATAEALPVEPAPSPTPTPETVATPLPTPSAVAAAPAPVAPAAADDRDGSDWLLPLGVVLALVAGGAWWWVRRRKDGGIEAPPAATFVEPLPEVEVASDLPSEPEPVAAAGAPRMLSRRGVAPVAPAPRAARAWIELELRPRRAGLNMLTATADVDIVVRNRGDADAANVRIDARLTSARTDQDAELGQVFAETGKRSVTPAFTLVPGGERVVRALVTLPREAINVLTAANRPMFVPVVTLNARYAPGGGGEGQTAQAFALGIERAGAAKLAPFWLDAPTRMFEAVAARPHALSITS